MLGTVGWIQAMLDAIGGEDAAIGGLRQTRLTATAPAEVTLGYPYAWDGTAVVLTPNTSELAAGDWIRLVSGGRAFEVLSIVPGVSVTVDLRDETAPVGPVATALTGTVTWNGTATVTMSAPGQVGVGVWIRYTTTGIWFQVTGVVGSAVTITNPLSLAIPTGSGSSYKSAEPRTVLVTTVLEVESTLDWEDTGSIALGGIWYRYRSRVLEPPALGGLSRDENGVDTYGLRQTHPQWSVVTDLSLAWSGVERMTRSILVEYAEGEYLNALGRNLGVNRYPFLESDDVFREIVKALAYTPKGTMFCLELALDAMVGRGNYELYEDLVNFPCTVFVRLLGGAATGDRSEGKTYLTGVEHRLSDSIISVDIAGSVVARGAVHSVQLRPEDRFSDFRNQFPTEDTQVEYDGGPSTPVWEFEEEDEVDNVTQIPGEGIEMGPPGDWLKVWYRRWARITPESYVSLQTVVNFLSTSTWSATERDQWVVRIDDSSYVVKWATLDLDATHVEIGLADGGAWVGPTVSLLKDVYHDVEIQKFGTSHVRLLVDGQVVDSQPYSDFTEASVGTSYLAFGMDATAAPCDQVARVRQTGFYARATDDYWPKRSTVSTAAANPTRVTAGGATFLAGDVGKQLVVRGGTVPNAYGGLADGTYEVATYVDVSNVEVAGKTIVATASVIDGSPPQITIPRDGPQFVFPDDLGKKVVISGSDQGNNGTYTITALLDPDTGVDLSTWATRVRTETNVAEVSAPGPTVTETDLTWRVDPDFVNDSGLESELSAAGSVVGSTLTLRQVLPYAPVVVDVAYSDVLSALVMLDFSQRNEIVQELPTVLWAYYPFYITDPLGFLRAYLDDLTAAGVIPEFDAS